MGRGRAYTRIGRAIRGRGELGPRANTKRVSEIGEGKRIHHKSRLWKGGRDTLKKLEGRGKEETHYEV